MFLICIFMDSLISHESAKLIKALRRNARRMSQAQRVVAAPVSLNLPPPRSPNLLPLFLVLIGVALMSRH